MFDRVKYASGTYKFCNGNFFNVITQFRTESAIHRCFME